MYTSLFFPQLLFSIKFDHKTENTFIARLTPCISHSNFTLVNRSDYIIRYVII